MVCSHVNGWMGYILAPEDYDRGGYEATLSFYGREEGTKVVEAGIKALKEQHGTPDAETIRRALAVYLTEKGVLKAAATKTGQKRRART